MISIQYQIFGKHYFCGSRCAQLLIVFSRETLTLASAVTDLKSIRESKTQTNEHKRNAINTTS